jgi:hypothetical protein
MSTKAAVRATLIVSLLISLVTGTLFVEVTKANPMPYPPTPSTDLPTLTIQTPENNSDTYANNNLELNFSVTKPDSWDSYGGMLIMPAVGSYVVWVYLDGTLKYYSLNLGSPGIFVTTYIAVFKNLTAQQHTITLSILATTYYGDSPLKYESNINQTAFFSIDADSKTIWFVMEPQTVEREPYPSYLLPLLPLPSPTPSRYQVKDPITIHLEDPPLPPEISNISVTNQTFNSNVIPLTFNVNTDTSWMAYSLDDKTNITISGNTTLANVTEGSHSIVVYANDTTGNMVTSQTAYFTVNPSPSPSPTSTSSPAAIPSPTIPEFPTYATLPLLAAAATFIACTKRRKNK